MEYEMQEQKLPGNILTVVIRNDAPLIHCGDCPSYRSVRIELTDEQLNLLGLKWTSSSGKDDYYEEISRCFIETYNVDLTCRQRREGENDGTE
jgi:hypothetical protein